MEPWRASWHAKPQAMYRGNENRSARLASLLNALAKDVCELCPHRNADWRVVYIEDSLAYYSAGNCPNQRCELADLLEARLLEEYGEPVGLERLPGEHQAVARHTNGKQHLDRDMLLMLE